MPITPLPGSLFHADPQRYANAVLETTDRAAKLTGQLLALARRQPMRSEVIDADANIEAMLDLVRQLVGSHIDVTFERCGARR